MITFIISALVLCVLSLGGTYYLGHSHGKQANQQTLNSAALQLSADKEAFDVIAEHMSTIIDYSKQRQQRIATAQQSNTARQQQEQVRVEYITQYVPQGATECERVSDAIGSVLR